MQVDFCETSVISSNKPFFPPTPPNLREITGVPRHWFHLINSPPLPSGQFWKHRRQGLLRLHRVGGWGGNQRQDATGQMENRGPPPEIPEILGKIIKFSGEPWKKTLGAKISLKLRGWSLIIHHPFGWLKNSCEVAIIWPGLWIGYNPPPNSPKQNLPFVTSACFLPGKLFFGPKLWATVNHNIHQLLEARIHQGHYFMGRLVDGLGIFGKRKSRQPCMVGGSDLTFWCKVS